MGEFAPTIDDYADGIPDEDYGEAVDEALQAVFSSAPGGMQINGAMAVSQVNAASAVTISTGETKYTVDQFQVLTSGAAVISAEQSTTVPDGTWQSSLKCTFTTADASLAAGDYSFLQTKIEGYRVAKLGFGAAGAASVSIGFWVRSSKTGTYHLFLQNAAINRSYVTPYTINQADTWEYKTVTIAGDTSGTWEKTTSTGLAVGWTMAAGSNFETTINTWGGVNALSASGAANAGDTTNATFYLTGVSVVIGSKPIPQAMSRRLQRSFDLELMLCQRYYEKSFPLATAPAQNAGVTGAWWTNMPSATAFQGYWVSFGVSKRIAPTMTLYNPSAANNDMRNATAGSDLDAQTVNATLHGFGIQTLAAPTAGNDYRIHWTADARL